MALQSTILISIGSLKIPAFKSFELLQKIDDHHDFKLTCRNDVLEKLHSSVAQETKDFLGETLILQVQALGFSGGYEELEFKGVVTSVNTIKGYHSSQGDTLVIKGKSSSILSDDGPHYTSYNDQSLSDILTKSFSGYDASKLETLIKPSLSSTLHYSVQHHESSFEYASRLAAQYGEWFYYDGKKLIFGESQVNEVPLTYGTDLQEFSLEINPKSNKYNFFTPDYLSSDQIESSTTGVNTGINGYNSFASKKGESIYAKETNVYLHSFDDQQLNQRIQSQIEKQKKATEIQQVLIKGQSDNPGVNLGAIVNISDETTNYGKFKIIKVEHLASENGKYQNNFEGIASDGAVFPKTDIQSFPKSETQIAIVKENADPEGLSRIRVQFPWQKPKGELTPWLRIISPHAGSEKGFHFIPEKGEEVLIGFEGGNAERPYVLGSAYNGKAKSASWGTEKNDIKAIRTRSGHTIELNDADGKEFIQIIDQNANTIHIDTANNNITITANEKITLNAKNFELNVQEDATFNIGNNTKISTGMVYESSSRSYKNKVQDKMETSVGGELTQNSGNAEIQSRQNMKIACGATASFQGGGNVKISKG